MVLQVAVFLESNAQHAHPTETANTLKIEGSDSREAIIRKAAHVVPTQNQYDALKNEFIAFIHFGPNTFTAKEWGSGMENPEIFDLKALDTDQWCEALQAAGMKMVILTVKHHDGFVLWQSRYTRHGIMSTDFKGGKGDVLRSLSESCRKYGLKLGVYLSPADLFQIENANGLYGNLSPYTERTIPRAVQGRPFANKRTFNFRVDDYNEYFLNQLFELLTEYGPIHEVWFDGAHPKRKGGQRYNYAAWKEVIRELAPQAVIFGREDVRWAGNEAGATRDTEWNVIPYSQNPDTASHFPDMTAQNIGGRDQLYDAQYLHYQQAETNTSIREGWFFRDDSHQGVRSVDDVFDIYERSVGGNSTFLLNVPPNREGKFSDRDVAVLKATGARIEETYGNDLLQSKQLTPMPSEVNGEVYVVLTGEKKELIVRVPEPVTINRLVLQEAVMTHGERVEAFVVSASINGNWRPVAEGTNIGYKRIVRFPDVKTDKLKIEVTKSRSDPAMSRVSGHYYKSYPPELKVSKTADGIVSIDPARHSFNWKPHGEDVFANLNNGPDIKIYYTLDGSDPDSTSTLYLQPFKAGGNELKAVATQGQITGPVLREQLGLTKRDWIVRDTGTKGRNVGVHAAIDGDAETFWKSTGSGKRMSLTIDLSGLHTLSGIFYTPPKDQSAGLLAKGTVMTSKDGKNWSRAGAFEFGNLVNDPSKRVYRFPKPVEEVRFVRVEAEEVTGGGQAFVVAEIDLF